MAYYASTNSVTEADKSGASGWIEITEQQFLDARDALMAGREVLVLDNSMVIRDKTEGDGEGPPPITLDGLKNQLKERVDADAEAHRMNFITAGAGQAMTYQQKAAEAEACLADQDPDPADYPLLAAEIGITDETLAGVATIVHGQHQAWRVIGAAIEGVRLGAKRDIDAAAAAEDAQGVFDAVEWTA